MKKYIVILFSICMIAFTSYAQKSILDEVLEHSPEIKEKAKTCVNISSSMLETFYKESTLTAPERYQSVSICASPSLMEDIRLLPAFKDYEKIMCVNKDDGRNICYYQKKTVKKGKTEQELLICMQQHNDFSAVYLRGENISIQDLGTHLDLIRYYMDKNSFTK